MLNWKKANRWLLVALGATFFVLPGVITPTTAAGTILSKCRKACNTWIGQCLKKNQKVYAECKERAKGIIKKHGGSIRKLLVVCSRYKRALDSVCRDYYKRCTDKCTHTKKKAFKKGK